jgi:hypothetical protein
MLHISNEIHQFSLKNIASDGAVLARRVTLIPHCYHLSADFVGHSARACSGAESVLNRHMWRTNQQMNITHLMVCDDSLKVTTDMFESPGGEHVAR